MSVTCWLLTGGLIASKLGIFRRLEATPVGEFAIGVAGRGAGCAALALS